MPAAGGARGDVSGPARTAWAFGRDAGGQLLSKHPRRWPQPWWVADAAGSARPAACVEGGSARQAARWSSAAQPGWSVLWAWALACEARVALGSYGASFRPVGCLRALHTRGAACATGWVQACQHYALVYGKRWVLMLAQVD